ncbi:hypothetical protein FRC01_013025 [Tulasnella sp. 417]|nr:hypothetical protein FRC01_013025 [Tulasnella sp. 417]
MSYFEGIEYWLRDPSWRSSTPPKVVAATGTHSTGNDPDLPFQHTIAARPGIRSWFPSSSQLSSSRSSEVHHQLHQPQARTPARAAATAPAAPFTPASAQTGKISEGGFIHAITQTMIGEFMYKYTRRVVGRGHGEKRHRRFFWIHPYTKTLYWSSGDPGSAGANESTAKIADVESVKAIINPNPLPPGVYKYSIVVSTPQREMKFTAPNKERYHFGTPPAPSP